MHSIEVKLGKRSYEIIIGKNILYNIGKFLKKLNFDNDIAIITNPTVREYITELRDTILSEGYRLKIVEVPDDERSKSFTQYYKVIRKLYQFEGKERYLGLIAFGGGVVGDLTGFIAATYKRGIPYIQIPTTLLAQVDSAIGGKTGIDTHFAKNLFGSIYQPRLVINDLNLLKTLPPKEIHSGLAEVIKYGVIENEVLFKFVENNSKDILRLNLSKIEYIVNTCCNIKARIVSEDEYDDVINKQIRAKLNFGHTIGHAIEAATKYKLYTHGEAVAIGMVAETEIAVLLGITKEETKLRLIELLKVINLPVNFYSCDIKTIINHMYYDKKFTHGKNRFVLPTRIGEVIIKENIKEEIIKMALKKVRQTPLLKTV